MKNEVFKIFKLTIAGILVSITSLAQFDTTEVVPTVNLNGPRLGVTYITNGELTSTLKNKFGAAPVITQFGWQFESRFFTLPSGTSGLIEGVVLIGGLEQGLFLPSLSGLIGLRSGEGTEFAFGPNLSLSGIGFAFTVGYTLTKNGINFPINLAVVPSPKGVRISIMFGFNARKV
ncbi:MAG: hypothetical protein HRT72_00820 [Flavobacteriales bacterium]|nr:hypothetical protein [Flavobacteriales bacterium]